ncbi:MAG TPA: hypothetical protein VNO70_07920 [Blastocatellia bacterium]|nr:hypothetical protein [Blastocatellia bacterium]
MPPLIEQLCEELQAAKERQRMARGRAQALEVKKIFIERKWDRPGKPSPGRSALLINCKLSLRLLLDHFWRAVEEADRQAEGAPNRLNSHLRAALNLHGQWHRAREERERLEVALSIAEFNLSEAQQALIRAQRERRPRTGALPR